MKRKLIKSLVVIALVAFSMPVMAYANSSNPTDKTTVINTNKLTKEGYIPIEAWENCTPLIDQVLKQTQKDDISKVTYEDLKNVKEINLYESELTSIPLIIFEIESLESLNLSFMTISNISFDKLGNLKNLKSLNLNCIGLSEFPEEIIELTNLEHLSLSMNKISSLPNDIGNLKNLKSLYLGKNIITKIPDSLYTLSNLENLDLGVNSLFTISSDISKLINLKTLSLEHCKLAEVPNVFKNMNDDLVFSISYNSLIKLPEIKPTQKMVYMCNFISCINNNSDTGIQIHSYENKLDINVGTTISSSVIEKMLHLTSDANKVDAITNLLYNPHAYEVVLKDNKILTLDEVKNLPVGKYDIRIKLAGSDLDNTFAITPEVITLNIIDPSASTKPDTPNDNTNTNNNNTNKPSEKPTVKPSETGKGSLPYTGGIASLATILGGSSLIGIGTILYKKKK